MIFFAAFIGVLHGFVAIAVGVAATVDAPGSEPAPDCAPEVTRRVQEWADGLVGFEANFEQVTRPVALGGGPAPESVTSKGRVFLARPGRMRWNYEEPVKSQVVSDGSELWIYDPAALEVQHLETTRGFLDGAALHFLMGDGRLADSFEIAIRQCDADELELEMVPRVDAGYERLALRVHAATGAVMETTLVDLLGNRTQVRFNQARSDRVPAASYFRFEVPAGVEVIEIRSSGPPASDSQR